MEKCSSIRSVIDEDINSGAVVFFFGDTTKHNYISKAKGCSFFCNGLFLIVDTSKWKKVRASDAGIRNSMIPDSSLNVLRLLRRQGLCFVCFRVSLLAI